MIKTNKKDARNLRGEDTESTGGKGTSYEM